MTTKKDKNKKEIIIKASGLSISINPCRLDTLFIYCTPIYDKFHVCFSHKALVEDNNKDAIDTRVAK
jgi:hypothetical protein